MGVEWGELPREIIESISKRLTIYIDYVRFRCVCRSWRLFVPKTPLHLPHQLPWLMLSHKSFFDLSTNKIHHLNLPLSSSSNRTRICGSSHGWLVILDETSKIRLLNPMTCAALSLPSLHTFPDLVMELFKGHIISDHYLFKVVLSSSPSLSDDFSALAILNHSDLAFCRKGYDSWVLLSVTKNHQWIDAVCKNDSFFAVSTKGTIAVCDVEGPRVSIIETANYVSYKTYCVVFSGEDMLLVTRYFLEQYVSHAEGFQILKMNWNALKWDRIQTLGENALFIGRNSSLSFSAADFVGCSPNCIYFTGNFPGQRDLGIFNLSDGSIEPLPCYPQNSYFRFGCPIWVTPNP